MNGPITEFWRGLSAPRRIALIGGVTAIGVFFVVTLLVLARPSYGLLFSGLEEGEAARITAALERLKVPYQLDAKRAAVLVEEDMVYRTRLQLAQEGLPAAGGKGFELFDNADYGMTEFAQKINYQRALQGELSRTISAIPEVKYARVHLVLPERTLFSSDKQRPSAAVTVLLRQPQTLADPQVKGIQSLVAASVEGMAEADVRVLDSRGIQLSRGDSSGASTEGRLELRDRIARHLERKLTALLGPALGPDSFGVSVEVTLDMSQRTTTTEAPHVTSGHAPLLRHQQDSKSSEPIPGVGKGEQGRRSVTESFEKEYALGRVIEEVREDGARIARLAVGVVLTRPLATEQLESVRQLISSSLGIDPARGDTLAVEQVSPLQADAARADGNEVVTPVPESESVVTRDPDTNRALYFTLALCVATLLIAGVFGVTRIRRATTTAEQKEKLVQDIRDWVRNGTDRTAV